MQGAISGSNKIRGGSLRDTRNVAQSTVTDDDAYKTKRRERKNINLLEYSGMCEKLPYRNKNRLDGREKKRTEQNRMMA